MLQTQSGNYTFAGCLQARRFQARKGPCTYRSPKRRFEGPWQYFHRTQRRVI